MKHTAVRRNAEVLSFVTTSESYTIHIEPDVRLDVAKCQNQKKGSSDAYMWIHAQQGYFVIHQDLSGAKPGPWRVIFEITPDHFSSSFFPWVDDEFHTLLADWEALPEEGTNSPDGE